MEGLDQKRGHWIFRVGYWIFKILKVDTRDTASLGEGYAPS